MEYMDGMIDVTDQKAYLIDIFPATVPAKEDNRYFAAEKYLQSVREETDRKFRTLLLKLYCYRDITVYLPEGIRENPEPEVFLSMLEDVVRKRGEMQILLPESGCVIAVDGNDLYLTVYDPDENLKILLGQLAFSEGLFFREAPVF